MQAFDQVCPEIAEREARLCDVTSSETGVPVGTYIFREFYCTDSGCDCRRVLVEFHPWPLPRPIKSLASINYGWEKPAYYRKWSSVPDMWREMSGPTLERFANQGPLAEQFLGVFKNVIKDDELVAYFQRHYRAVKDLIGSPRRRKKG
jgi:hypothetical protein